MSIPKKGNETIPFFEPPLEHHKMSIEDFSKEENTSNVTISYFDDFGDDEPTKVQETYRKNHIPKGILGEGGMGRVYAAEDPLLHREVAIKTMLKQATPQSAYWKRFMREAQITAQLAHPAIIPVYGLDFNDEQQPFLIMKKIEGTTLTEYIKSCIHHNNEDLFGVKARIERLIHVCSAMNYAHNHGVIHRDLKPDNIMVGAFDEMIVMDWGTARVTSEKEDIDPSLLPESDVSINTMYGALIGTPLYMSPEQAKGESNLVGPASDQFALGMILYELIELTVGRTGRNLTEILQRAIAGNPLIFSEKTPLQLQSIVNKATARNIDERYSSIGDFAQDLRFFIRGEPVDAHPENIFRSVWRSLSRHPILSVGFLFASLLFTLLLIIYSLNNNLSHQKEIQLQQEKTAALIDTVSTEARAIDNILSNIQIQLHGLTRAVSLKYGTPTTGTCLLPEEIPNHESAILVPKMADVHLSLSQACCFTAEKERTEETSLGNDLGTLLLPDFLSVGYTIKESDEQDRIDSKIQWIYVGTESGVIINYPGISFFPKEYDPRKRPWYGDGKNNKLPKCGNPYPDASGMGFLLPCTQRIETIEGTFIGVSGIDIELDEVIEIIQEFKGFLLNDNLEIMLKSSDRGRKLSSEEAIKNNKEKERSTFNNPHLIQELKKNKLNGVVYNSKEKNIYTYARLQFAPWTLVLEFKPEQLKSIINKKPLK